MVSSVMKKTKRGLSRLKGKWFSARRGRRRERRKAYLKKGKRLDGTMMMVKGEGLRKERVVGRE